MRTGFPSGICSSRKPRCEIVLHHVPRPRKLGHASFCSNSNQRKDHAYHPPFSKPVALPQELQAKPRPPHPIEPETGRDVSSGSFWTDAKADVGRLRPSPAATLSLDRVAAFHPSLFPFRFHMPMNSTSPAPAADAGKSPAAKRSITPAGPSTAPQPDPKPALELETNSPLPPPTLAETRALWAIARS